MKIALIFVLSMATAFAQTSSATDPVSVNFLGKWTGQLEYRDYTTNGRVLLPTWLEITNAPEGMRFAYIYDDGPTKTVRETITMKIDAGKNIATFISEDKKSSTYNIEGLKEFMTTGHGKLILTGTGVENEKKVDVRITITLRRNLYQYVKETRPAGEEFQFRDAYTFTRATPPQS